MDNFTHSLVGMLIAETAIEVRKPPRTAMPAADWRPWAWLASVVASNFPDLDFLYAPLTPGKVGALLHHRGHTHTFLGAVVLSAVLFGIFYLTCRKRLTTWSRKDWFGILWLLIAGFFAHILMDGLNSYGVHPLWPFNNHWFYADTLFIVEPWLWTLLLCGLYWAVPSRRLKILFLALILGELALFWKLSMISETLATALTVGSIVGLVLFKQLNDRVRLISIWAGSFALGLIFFLSGVRAESLLKKLDFASGEVVDSILNPLPGNPLCWIFITVHKDNNNGTYRLTRGVLSEWPSMVKPEDCRLFRDTETIVPMETVPLEDPHFKFFGRYEYKLADLSELSKNCWVQAILRFSRAPFIMKEENKVLVGDLRFVWGRHRGFSEVEVEDPASHCPPFIPPWDPPRQDLIGIR